MKLLPVVVALLMPALAGAQDAQKQGAQNEQSYAQGKSVFRSNCAFCHGLTATGGRGPSLISAKLLRGSTDEDIKKIIQNGVPGTTMPSFENIDKDDLESLVGFIRHLAGSEVKSAPVPGDATAGRKVYERSGCSGCHRVGNEGSIYGPDLTRVGG
ncbi:MAG: c-type cytochrome, partial [Acidobacteriota bacterium]|nr:c-type cytochrome [Acidobacteriota bacterium]